MKTTTTQPTQCLQLQHNRVFNIDTPCNGSATRFGGHNNQPLIQRAQRANFAIGNVHMVITRIRLVMHDACLLSVKNHTSSLGLLGANNLAADELYFWKRDNGGVSNV